MAKRGGVRHVSFTTGQKKQLIADLGYEVFQYSGKINDAPRQWKHYYRDLKAGYYLIQSGTSKPLRLLTVPESTRYEETQRNVTDAAFIDTIAREVAYRLQGIYVFVGKEVNTHEFRSKEDIDVGEKYLDEVAAYVASQKVKNGYYFYSDKGNMVGPYKSFLVLLLDAMMEEDIEELYCYGTVTSAAPIESVPKQPKNVPEFHTPQYPQVFNPGIVARNGITIQHSGAFDFVLQNGVVIGMFFQPGLAQQMLA